MPSRASPLGLPRGSSSCPTSEVATTYYGAGLNSNACPSGTPQTVYEGNAHVVREIVHTRAMYEGSSGSVRAIYDSNGRAIYDNNAHTVYARGNRFVYGNNQQHHNLHNNNNNHHHHPSGGTLRGNGPSGTVYGTHPRSATFDLDPSFECVTTYDISNQNVVGTPTQAPYIAAPPSAYIAGNQNTLTLSTHYNANRTNTNAYSTSAPLVNALPNPSPHPNNAHTGAQQSKSPCVSTQGRSNAFDSTTGTDSKQNSIPRFRIPPGARLSHSYKHRRSSCPFAFHYTPQPFSVHRTRSVMEDGLSVSSGSAASGAGGSSLGGDEVVLRINVPELKVEKCLQFHKDDLVWDVKQQALAALPKELRESFNYGLFCPPQNGRAGKFLDEERPLVDYPFTCPVGYLELKYKRRVYKMLRIEEKALRALHTRANLRRFVDSVKENNTDKVTKMCAKGLDPNFHCQESGETPLTIAARVKKSGRLLVALVNGGALLDYRSRDGVTAMHRAVQANNFEAVKTMLDLGASPNYRDSRGLTPLYYSVTHATDPLLCEALLHDYASIGATDNQGWHEVHQACRNKLVQHLEHLLFYGADMNAQNASGNTPLHVCAVNNLEDCTRVLLFRGCDKNALNFANQTPYQVAVIAGNMELAEVIKNHSIDDVVPFKEPPKYNPNRRISGAPLSRAQSDPRLEVCAMTKPPSPSPSSRSIPPFSSASSLSETSTGSGSTCTHPSEMDSEECVSAVGSASINAAAVECCDVVSDSSGVCTSNSGSAESYDATPTDASQFDVGMLVVCLQQYTPHKPGHLDINPGDILEITGSTDTGYLEGCLKGVTGVFPPHCVQEVRLRNPQAVRESLIAPQVSRVQGRREMTLQQYGTAPRIRKLANEPRTVVLHRGKKGFGFVLRGAKATSPLMERPGDRGPALQYLDDVDPGGVADLAGLKRGDYLLKINGEDVSQASHEHVVTLIRKSGDLVQMTVMSPVASSFTANKPPTGNLGTVRRGCQTLPRKLHAARNSHAPAPPPRDPRTTLSVGRARAKSMVAGLQDIEALDASMRDPSGAEMSTSRSAYQIPGGGGGGMGSGSTGSGGGSGVNSGGESQRSTPSGTPQQGTPVGTPPGMKVASIKARPSSKRMTAAEVEEMMLSSQGGSLPSSPPATPTGKAPRVYASVAEMKKAKAQKARMLAESSKLHKDFHSTPDLQVMAGSPQHQLSIQEKRKSHSQEDLFVFAWNARNSRHSLACPPNRFSHMDRRLEESQECNKEWQGSTGNTSEDPAAIDSPDGSADHKMLRRSQSAVNPQMLRRAGLHPPPSHPPPPPPLGQLVKVDIARSKSDYATVGLAPSTPTSTPSSPGIMSSFRPTDCAKLYASPEEIKAVGYRSPDMMGTLNRKNGNGKSRSQSLPPSTSRPSVHKGIQEKDSSNDSGIYSTTYSTFRGSETDSTRSQESDNSAHSSTSTSSSSSSQNSMSSDTVTYARPKNNRSIVEPAKKVEEAASAVPVEKQTPQKQQQASPDIPEPDYSSDEDNTYDSQDDAQARKVRATKKKNYSVMFSPNISSSASDMCDTPHYAAPAKSPIPATQGSNFKELIAKKAAERQSRSDSLEEGKSSTPPIGSPSKTSSGENGNGSKAISDAIQQSAIFQRQKEKTTNGGLKHRASLPTSQSQTEEPPKTCRGKLKSVKSCPSDFNMEDGDNSSSGVSSDQEVQGESNNYVTVINTEFDTISGQKSLERLPRHTSSRDDSSEASESSDEASDRTWILTNEKPEKSELAKETESAGTRRTGTLTRNAVSLVKLPPPQESGEPDIEVDLNLSAQQRMSRSVDQDTISTLSSLSSLSSGSGSTGDRDIPPSSHHHLSGRGLPPQGPPHQGPPHQGPPHQGPPHQGPPHQCPPHQGPPHQGPPHQGPPHQGPPHQGPPPQGPPLQGPPHQGPPHQGPPHQGPPHQGPPHQGPPLQPHPLQGHPLQGHVMQRPPSATLTSSTSSLGPGHTNRAMAGGTLDRNRCNSRDPHGGAEYMTAMERAAVPYVMSASCPDHGHHPSGTNVDTGETEYERSIEESLQLIRQHMDSLNEVNTLAGIQAQTDSSGMVLAPPPEFSDLSGMTARQGAAEKNRTVIHISSDTYEPTTRMVGTLTKSMSCSSSEDTRNFRTKTLSEWTTQDTTDWLESLFMPEYKNSFAQQEIDGQKLMCLNNDAFINLGVRRVGHRINMEKSLKRYMPVDRIDL